ncbi:MAG: YfhO family protein [Lachnospiraceae bacterium]|nr:YfhO family protein [Lachnospiraceae bacterium]
MEPIQEVSKKYKIIVHSLSALIPMLILGTMFALNGIYPFGDYQILITDFWQQYYPFISDYWHKVREGSSLLWSWTAGGGYDFTAHFAYYLASPFNLLAILFPHAYLREMLTLFLLFKVGLSGLFMSMFLGFSIKRYDVLLPVFSSFYALSAFTLGYYWNIMWFDTIALLPLVILGVYSLVKEGKYRLYTISLALAVLFNFYIGIFVCIFVAIMFFAQCFIAKLDLRIFIKRLVTIAICSIVALGMAAILLLPVYSALQNAFRTGTVPSLLLYNNFLSVIGNFIAFTPPTSMEGLPNLYSGMISIMLIPVFMLSEKTSVRETIIYTSIAFFLVLSTNVNILDIMWNAFTNTNMLPARFSFLVPFVVILIAYKAYLLLLEEMKFGTILAMGISAAFFLLMADGGLQQTEHIIHSAILSAVYLALFILLMVTKKLPFVKRYLFKCAFFIVILAELSLNAYNGVASTMVSGRSEYPLHYEDVQTLLKHRQTDDTDFFRTERTMWHTFNDPSIHSFEGISFFSSFANMHASKFTSDLGLPSWDAANRNTYIASSPLTNAFLNIRYMLARDAHPIDNDIFWEYIASEGESQLYKSNQYLPFGFMAKEEIVNYIGDERNPFNSQNDLFRKATGLDGDLFTLINVFDIYGDNYSLQPDDYGAYDLVLDPGESEGMFRVMYEMPSTDLLYIYANFIDVNNVRLTTGETEQTLLRNLELRRPTLFSAGRFESGQFVSIEADSDLERVGGDILAGILNQDLFLQGMEILSAETLTLTEFSDTRFTGDITVTEPGVLYTSLPHAGNWRVFVNGVEEDIVTIGGAMAGVRLGTGDHTVEFRYHNQGVILGAIISILSFLLYLTLLFLHHKKIDVFEYFFTGRFSLKKNKEKISYLFFGILTTLINWGVYSLAVQMIGFSITVSNVIAWIFAVVFAFITNKLWVFENHDWKPKSLLAQSGTFLGSRLFTGLIELVGVPLLFLIGLTYPLFGIEGFAAKVAISVIVVILNYILSKKIVFKANRPMGRII